MSNKKTFINSVKKEYLLFKKEKSAKFRQFSDDLEEIFGIDGCFLLEPEVVQAINFKTKYVGVESVIHSDFNKMIEIELSSKDCDIVGDICNYIELSDEDWILVYSSEWELCGGFLVDMKHFFSHLNKVSWIMDDDFIVLNKNLDSSLKISGDRIDDEISIYSMVSRGDNFYSIVDSLNKYLDQNK